MSEEPTPNDPMFKVGYQPTKLGRPRGDDISLRDRFAGQVAGHIFQQLIMTGSIYKPEKVAKDAYEIADAMLVEREKAGGKEGA